MPVEVKRDDIDKVLKEAVRSLLKNDVLVGIPDTNAERQQVPGEGTPPSNALIGYIMETGSPARNIPARPFLTPGIQDARDGIVAQMRKGAEAAFAGDPTGVEQSQNAAGLIAQSAVKARIASNTPPPLSARTLAARRRRGVTRENSLVDTGALLNSVTYVIRPKKGA